MRALKFLLAVAVALMVADGVPVGAVARDDPAKRGMVAVFEIEVDGMTLSPKVVANLTAYLASRMTAEGGYKTVASNRIEKALVEKKRESHANACDKTCQIELAQKVSADKVLHSKIWRVGNVCSVMLDLYDLESEVMEKSVEVEASSCTEPQLKKAVAAAVQRLGTGEAAGTPVRGGGAGGSGSVWLPPPPVDSEGVSEPVNNASLPAVKAETGYLFVQGEAKGARVDISGPKGFGDNGKVATSLPVAPFEVPAGTYTVRVSMTGYDAEESQVRIYADATDGVKVNLVQSNGQVSISGKPEGAKARLECQKGFVQDFGLPATPWTVSVPRGECRLTVSRDGYAGYDRRFTVEGGGQFHQFVELARDTTDGGTGITVGRGGVEWVRIPGGTFQMGSNDTFSDEKPVHSVTVQTFEMAKTETTVAQYRKCVDAGVCTVPLKGQLCNWDESGRDNYPVNCVNWNQALAYAKWVGGRLPTEAEWEYAARSGGLDRKYPWGNQEATCAYAVMNDGTGTGCGRDSTWPVCTKPAGNTAQGLCDMSGNVSEWVQDRYQVSYAGAPSNGSAWEGSGNNRVSRGGSWDDDARYARASNRDNSAPAFPGFCMGLRPARSVP